MKLVAVIKVAATEEQKAALLATLRRCNEAASWLSLRAFESKTFDKFKLQKLHYAELRARFGVKAQLAIRVLAKVADSYKKDQKTVRHFRPLGAIAFDKKLYCFKDGLANISLMTIDGRILCPTVIGPYFADLLKGERGEAELVCRKGKLFFHVSVEAAEQPQRPVTAFLGVDLGIVNLATDSDRNHYTGEQVEKVRARYASLRRRLQQVGTTSAKKHLKKLAGKEARFRQIENHRISKALVKRAHDTGRGIAMEDLHGLRDRVKVRRHQRARHAGWAFFQLRQMTTYKALHAGVPLAIVDPRNTSRECLLCHHIAKENRRSQSEFCCVACGFEEHADVVGAKNVSSRAAVNRPMVSSPLPKAPGRERQVPTPKRRAKSPVLQGVDSLRDPRRPAGHPLVEDRALIGRRTYPALRVLLGRGGGQGGQREVGDALAGTPREVGEGHGGLRDEILPGAPPFLAARGFTLPFAAREAVQTRLARLDKSKERRRHGPHVAEGRREYDLVADGAREHPVSPSEREVGADVVAVEGVGGLRSRRLGRRRRPSEAREGRLVDASDDLLALGDGVLDEVDERRRISVAIALVEEEPVPGVTTGDAQVDALAVLGER